MNKPVDPYDPHHVALQIVIDLQSTNMQRQKEILRLRSDLDTQRIEAAGQRRRGDELEQRIRKALRFIEESKNAKGTLQLVRQALDVPGPDEDTMP